MPLQDYSEAEALGLSDVESFIRNLPAGIDGNRILEAIHTANMAVDVDRALAPTIRKRQVLSRAGLILLEEMAMPDAALHLTKCIDPDGADSAPLVHVRLITLRRMEKIDELMNEAVRILQSTGDDMPANKIVRHSLRRWNLERLIPLDAKHLSAYFGNPEEALARPFSSAVSEGPYPLAEIVAPVIARLQGQDPADVEFSSRLKWGAQVLRQMIFLRGLSAKLAAQKVEDRTDAENMAVRLCGAHQALISGVDPAEILAEISLGRSVVIADVHAGLATAHNHGLPFGDIPLSVLANAAGKSARPKDFNISTQSPALARDVAKLVKMMRKEPRIVRVFPDGGQGECATIKLFGREVQIGRGAAMISYSGRASVFFVRTRWNGTRFVVDLHRGPSAFDYADKDKFERDFNEFYANRLEDIVMGAPEDMAPVGGFWRFLRT